MRDPESNLHLGARNHLFLTENLVIRGQIDTLVGRLIDVLNAGGRTSVRLVDCVIARIDGAETAAELDIPLAAIVLAHEYVDQGSDAHLRAMAAGAPTRRVRLQLLARGGVELCGVVRDEKARETTPFLVLQEPDLPRGGDAEVSAFAELPYVLVARNRIETMIPFGGPAA